MIDRYLRGQLSPDELADFELRMLEEPDFFDAVLQAEQMHLAFKQSEMGNSEYAVPPVRHRPVSDVSMWQWIRQPMSMAASLALVAALGAVSVQWMQAPDWQSMTVTDNGYALNSVVTLASTRSQATEIILPVGIHLLQIDVGVAMDQPMYQVTVSPQGESGEFQFELLPDANGILRLLSSSAWQGPYTVSVQRIHESQSAPGIDNETNRDSEMTYAIRFVLGNPD